MTDQTMPANAPAGSDSSEREALAQTIIASDYWKRTAVYAYEIADAIIAAGFTRRAQHDGERVAIVRGAGCQCSDADACRFVRGRDEAQEQIATMNLALLDLRAERDALAAQLHARDDVIDRYAKDTTEAIARAEAAESREADAIKHATLFRESMQQSDNRAAALAEALREIGEYDVYFEDMASAVRHLNALGNIARAALAGNGNGTGEG